MPQHVEGPSFPVAGQRQKKLNHQTKRRRHFSRKFCAALSIRCLIIYQRPRPLWWERCGEEQGGCVCIALSPTKGLPSQAEGSLLVIRKAKIVSWENSMRKCRSLLCHPTLSPFQIRVSRSLFQICLSIPCHLWSIKLVCDRVSFLTDFSPSFGLGIIGPNLQSKSSRHKGAVIDQSHIVKWKCWVSLWFPCIGFEGSYVLLSRPRR